MASDLVKKQEAECQARAVWRLCDQDESTESRQKRLDLRATGVKAKRSGVRPGWETGKKAQVREGGLRVCPRGRRMERWSQRRVAVPKESGSRGVSAGAREGVRGPQTHMKTW